MAIQIDENKISPVARKALANAKSKSQLLRDALEFYVNSRAYITGETEEEASSEMDLGDFKVDVIQDLQEIKSLILKLSQGSVSMNAVDKNVDKPQIVDKKTQITNVPKVEPEPQRETAISKVEHIPNTSSKGAQMTEEQKRAYEESFDSVIDI